LNGGLRKDGGTNNGTHAKERHQGERKVGKRQPDGVHTMRKNHYAVGDKRDAEEPHTGTVHFKAAGGTQRQSVEGAAGQRQLPVYGREHGLRTLLLADAENA
jgi:hypothetical protein